jgi:DNA-binding Lrp family transcriptional regulator
VLEPLGDEVKRELARFGPQGRIAEVVEAWPTAVGEIRKRLDVEGLKFVPGPLPEARTEPAETAVRLSARPSPEQVEEAARIAGGIADENLRKLVQKAVETALARAPDDRSF